jgi:antitoxin component YwqK of YwqJK toxin-antitoxin module
MQKQHKKNGYHKLINQKTGKLKLIKNYKDGAVHGKIIYYWDNGNIRLSGQYNKTHRVGIWKNYDNQGQIIFEENYNIEDEKIKDQLHLSEI